MKEDKGIYFFFACIFIFLVMICLGMEFYTIKVNNLENSLESVQEEIQTQRNIFSSYLNKIISKDVGGNE